MEELAGGDVLMVFTLVQIWGALQVQRAVRQPTGGHRSPIPGWYSPIWACGTEGAGSKLAMVTEEQIGRRPWQ